jgi:hypothetical protein
MSDNQVFLINVPTPEHSGLREMSSMAVSPRKRMPLLPMNWIVYLNGRTGKKRKEDEDIGSVGKWKWTKKFHFPAAGRASAQHTSSNGLINGKI